MRTKDHLQSLFWQLLFSTFTGIFSSIKATQFNPVQLRQGTYWTTTMPVQGFTTSLGACPSMMSHDADLRYSSLAQKLLLQATCSPCSPQWLFLTPPHPQVSHCPSRQMTCPLTAPTLHPTCPWVTKMENADHEAPFNNFPALGVESKPLNAIIRVPDLSLLFSSSVPSTPQLEP